MVHSPWFVNGTTRSETYLLHVNHRQPPDVRRAEPRHLRPTRRRLGGHGEVALGDGRDAAQLGDVEEVHANEREGVGSSALGEGEGRFDEVVHVLVSLRSCGVDW